MTALSAGLGLGLAAAGLFLVFSTTWHDYDALAANCELFLLRAAGGRRLAAAARARAPDRAAFGRWRLHLAVGALIGRRRCSSIRA